MNGVGPERHHDGRRRLLIAASMVAARSPTSRARPHGFDVAARASSHFAMSHTTSPHDRPA